MTITPTLSDAPQVAVNDIGSEEDFLAAIDETIKYFNDGDIVEGTIVKVDRDEVLLDIGYKTEGVIPSRELSIKHDVDPNEVVEVGDKVEALVLQKEDKEGRLILSKKRAQYERAWGTIEQVKEEDGVVEGTVIEVVKGGLIIDIGLRGFLPASLVEMRRVRDLQPYVGQVLEAKIIELDKNRNNVVLSRRAWLEQTQSEVRHGFLTQLQKGQIRKGVVSSIVNFGAFVDLGGVDGLVHVSELSWKHIDHPSEVVTVGDEVTVEVLDVDMDRERVSLSLKATQAPPRRFLTKSVTVAASLLARRRSPLRAGVFRSRSRQTQPEETSVPRGSATANRLWQRIGNVGEDFWAVVGQAFKARELTRADLDGARRSRSHRDARQLSRAACALQSAGKRLQKFHAFLYQQRCNLPVASYRARRPLASRGHAAAPVSNELTRRCLVPQS